MSQILDRTCTAVSPEGYPCELPALHDGEHAAFLNDSDEQGAIPQLRWTNRARREDAAGAEPYVIRRARALREKCDAAAFTEADGMYVDLNDLGAITRELIETHAALSTAERERCDHHWTRTGESTHHCALREGHEGNHKCGCCDPREWPDVRITLARVPSGGEEGR